MQSLIDDIASQVSSLVGSGKVADYIPALGCIDPKQFGMAVQTTRGECFTTGHADTRFSIQSISKVLSLTLALEARSEKLWERVGKEPSGDPFNSLTQLEYERGIPRNPLINAGAIITADCLVSDHQNGRQTLLDLVHRLSDDSVEFDEAVATSERETGSRNAALAYLMKSFGNLENDVDTVLDTYFHQCSLAMSCRELARCFCYLASAGEHDGQRIVGASRARRINALMLTCGTYDRAGEFAFEVGLPAKSGVGGGIVAIVPGELSLAVWSPGLGPSGNSIAGTEALKLFGRKSGLSIF